MPEHQTAAILSIGDELTLGQKLDTNSQWLSRRLMDLGVQPVEHATVDDDLERISGAITRLCEVVDLVIVTGGLGPTSDDLTRAAVARALGVDLVEDPRALRMIEAWYRSRGRDMPPANRVQAFRPASARFLVNRNGTAPGLSAMATGATIICLPGPPSEMRPMFERWQSRRLRPPTDRIVRTRVLQTFGAGESNIAGMLGSLMDRDRDPLIGTTASTGVVSIRIRSEKASSTQQADKDIDREIAHLRDILGPLIYSESDTPLPEAILQRLISTGQSLATVESCTGGLLGQMLTAVSGASDAYAGGWVTYSNAMKQTQVGVDPQIIERFGAVSRECAEQLASGGLLRSEADHCLSITGIAGPGGGSEAKPVGTVWIGLASADASPDVRRFLFKGSRDQIRLWAANTAMGMLRQRLDGIEGELLGEAGR